ncbi:PhaM family polyhydroxyalkanoate granule multifunctional regulatory protein [Rhodoferax antarcticus]|uniref:PhaM family polyhydroxyalkanoate granule multifunctional regulatory protein n=1 Tax=Rhodoferax antarcticus TaxID=81479 RepID=UPI002224A738|nr:PhaM family polyhydroxyalkanoate granule multifunctional regulatory protein [Rhodoferax antarcticus]MCW2313896.1 hypothetical protein [Rhodoferax antarcticus]
MSDSNNTGFSNFIPGFDFLQNLAKSTAGSVPHMPSWIAPTLSVEELDKRISELKTVQFWLDQNAKALAATVQALEVQKMTLATLKGMNLNLSEMANHFMPKAAAPTPAATSAGYQWPEKAATPAQPVAEAAEQAPETAKPAAPAASLAGLVDPMHMWSALTQQFQSIAASAMAEAGKVGAMAEASQASAVDMGENMLKSVTQGAAKVAAKKDTAVAKKTAAKPVAAKTPGKKAAAKSDADAPKAIRRNR